MPSGQQIGTGVGAVAGSIIPGVGTFLGGALGGLAGNLLGGLFGGGEDDESPEVARRKQIREALLARLNARSNSNFDPFQSTTFQSGIGSLRDLLGDQRTRDEGRAAAVGLPGAEIGKASQAGRLRALTQGQRGLLGQSAQIDAANRNSAQGSLLSLLGLQSTEDQAGLNRGQRNRDNRNNLIGQLGSAGINYLATR